MATVQWVSPKRDTGRICIPTERRYFRCAICVTITSKVKLKSKRFVNFVKRFPVGPAHCQSERAQLIPTTFAVETHRGAILWAALTGTNTRVHRVHVDGAIWVRWNGLRREAHRDCAWIAEYVNVYGVCKQRPEFINDSKQLMKVVVVLEVARAHYCM